MATAYTRLIPETEETSFMSFSARFSKLSQSSDFRGSLNKTIGAICADAGPLPPHRLSVDGWDIEPVGITLEEYQAMTPKDRLLSLGRGAVICGIDTIRLPANPIPDEMCRQIGATILDTKQLGLYDLYHNDGYLVNHTTNPSHAHQL